MLFSFKVLEVIFASPDPIRVKVSSITYVDLIVFPGNISTRGFRDERNKMLEVHEHEIFTSGFFL